MELTAAVIMMLAGIGILGIWSVDISLGKFAGRGTFFAWREGENLLWPHIVAEYLTALALLIGGTGLLMGKGWAYSLSFAALGALVYTAINSSGWVLASRERIGYAIPIWISLVGAVVSIWLLL